MNDIHEGFMSYAIELAKKELDWEPKISLVDGLDITRNYFKEMLFK